MKLSKLIFKSSFLVSIFVWVLSINGCSKSFNPNYFLKIGFTNGITVLSSFIDSSAYYYQNNVLTELHSSPSGYFPVFANDSYVIFIKEGSKKIQVLNIQTMQYNSPITLPEVPHALVANEACDTIVFIADGPEYNNLKLFSVHDQVMFTGPKSNYEEFFFTNGWLYYSSSISEIEKKVLRRRIGLSSNNEDEAICKLNRGHLLFVDPLDRLVTSEYIDSKKRIQIVDLRGKILETYSPSKGCHIFFNIDGKYKIECP